MIKQISILAFVRLLFSTLAVGAASVTPSAATDYIFTTPLFPSSIRGEVMGDPPAYYDPRGEDVDWMFEAFEERFALMDGVMPSLDTHLYPSFGTWSLSTTNNFFRWSTAVNSSGDTNVVVGYSLLTNAPAFSLASQDVVTLYNHIQSVWMSMRLGYETGSDTDYRSRYLDDGAELSDSARVAYDRFRAPSYTNVTSSIIYTNIESTNVSFVVMPMTNGTVSVFTNRWTATFSFPVTNAVTNVVEACPIDYCHALNGPFPGFPNAAEFDAAVTRPKRDGVTARMYDALRAARRLADDISITNVSPPSVIYSHSIYDSPDGQVETGGTTTNSSGSVGCSYTMDGINQMSYVWDSQSGQYVVYPQMSVTESCTPAYDAEAPTRFSSDVVTTGGAVRVEIEAAYAVVEFYYLAAHQVGGPTNLTWETDLYVDKIIVVPVEGASLDISHPVALARVRLDAKALCASAASVANVPGIPENAAEYHPQLGISEVWNANCSGIVVIYRTNPTSKFSDW